MSARPARANDNDKHPPIRHRPRFQVTLDPETVEILAEIIREIPEVENRSEAIRYAIRMYAARKKVRA